jgi:hypothetical protein
MTFASGIYKQVAYKVETTFGTQPTASAAQSLRRVQSTLDLSKDTFQSNEIRTDLQVADYRHGVKRVKGAINGELQCKTYADFIAAAVKKDFAAGVSASAVGITIAGTYTGWTVTRAAGSYLTDGFKIGDVIRLSVGGLNAANISRNLMIIALTATIATCLTLNNSNAATGGTAMVAEGPISGCTVTVQGKKTYIPSTGHTDKSFTVEHFYSDITQSECFTGCKVDKISINLPPTGLATIGIDFVGQNLVTAASQYFTSPTAATTTSAMAAVNGVLRFNGATVAYVTGLSFSIDPGFTGDPVVGSNTVPALFAGTVNSSGQATAYFQDATLRDLFVNETECDLYCAFTADNTATADFVCFSMARIKVGGASKGDGQGGLVQTLPFKILKNTAGGSGIATEATTISVQDAQA